MAKKATNGRFNGKGNWATVASRKHKKAHNEFMRSAGLGGVEAQVVSQPVGTCSHCPKKFTDATVDALRKQLLAHWEQTHREGTPSPITTPRRYNGDYPIVDDKRDEDIE